MANVIKKAQNKFQKGLVMDFSPENTSNEVLTHALNATLLTFNGNELSLQNDMGNGRVETAYLPEGYIPVGTCEYGGIIYIVSYNPLEDKSQIGCFPSPERNISSDELGCIEDQEIKLKDFQEVDDYGNITGKIKNTSKNVILRNDKLNPGDKFIVYADESIYEEKLQDLFKRDNVTKEFNPIENPMIALNLVSIEESGRIIYLNSELLQYNKTYKQDVYKYHILGKQQVTAFKQEDIDDYRNTLSSGYNVFKSKISGKLAILAELVMIDSYTVTHSLVQRYDELNQIIPGGFDVVIHTEVSPELNVDNYLTKPKLAYYYLQNSQGYVQTVTQDKHDKDQKNDTYLRPLFINNQINSVLLNTRLNEIYESNDAITDLTKTIQQVSILDFPVQESYHERRSLINDVNNIPKKDVFVKLSKRKKYYINKASLYSDGEITEIFNTLTNTYKAQIYTYDPSKSYSSIIGIPDSYTDYYIEKSIVSYQQVSRTETSTTIQKNCFKIDTHGSSIADKAVINDATIQKWAEIVDYIYTDVSYKNKDELLVLITSKNLYRSFIDEDEGKTRYTLINSESDLDIWYGETSLYTKDILKYFAKVDQDNVGDYSTLYYFKAGEKWKPLTDVEKFIYFNYEETDPYPFNEHLISHGAPFIAYTMSEVGKYYIKVSKEEDILLYYQGYSFYCDDRYNQLQESDIATASDHLIIVVPEDTYIPYEYFINGYFQDHNQNTTYVDPGIKSYCVPMPVYQKFKFLPDENYKYEDVHLAYIKIPTNLVETGNDFLFQYDYTLVPCMEYGKLQHLAVSNTIDFSKLHNFGASDINIWKYHIDGNSLRLTFGAEVYDTYEDDKVDGLILEFYDLWGFAGSISILDKQSYSGIFNKLLSLNTLNALSPKRVYNGVQEDGYCRNINIIKKDDKYFYNDKELEYNPKTGWSYVGGSVLDMNDCGVLYSNILYGVKTYLRRTTTSGIEYIPKSNFFLYTSPIYNEFYYTVNNFNTLQPSLDFALTFRVTDVSSKQPYTSSDQQIKQGYVSQDSDVISAYTSGRLQANYPDIYVTNYQQFTGESRLQLELGLQEQYEQMGIACLSDINKLFSCYLLLTSDDDQTKEFNISSEKPNMIDPLEMLCYKHPQVVNLQNNKIQFDGKSGGYTIDVGEFQKYNFLYTKKGQPSDYLKIKYQFVVGYDVSITDIKLQNVPMTTICALCHQDKSGEYNYDDFNLSYNADVDSYTSTAIFINDGNAMQELFGVYEQTAIDSTTPINKAVRQIDLTSTNTKKYSTPGKLNTGDPLRKMSQFVGKLSFFQPHGHGYQDDCGVNLYQTNSVYYSNPDYIIPSDQIRNTPRFNMCANTQDSIDRYSEFISVINFTDPNGVSANIVKGYKNQDGKYVESYEQGNYLIEFQALSLSELSTLYKYLMQSMKTIYAYNPDYDTIQVQAGNVTVVDNKISFSTNLICEDAKLDLEQGHLNEFIYLSGTPFNTYLEELYNHSGIPTYNASGEPLKQVRCKENLRYCGVSQPVLLTTLTYKIPDAQHIHNALSFNKSDCVLVKHHDNKNNKYLQGSVNRRALYGYEPTWGKLIELDINNYTVATDGSIKIKTNYSESDEKTIEITKGYELMREEGSWVDLAIGGKAYISFATGAAVTTETVELNNKQYTQYTDTGFGYTLHSFKPEPDDNDDYYVYNLFICADVDFSQVDGAYAWKGSLDIPFKSGVTYNGSNTPTNCSFANSGFYGYAYLSAPDDIMDTNGGHRLYDDIIEQNGGMLSIKIGVDDPANFVSGRYYVVLRMRIEQVKFSVNQHIVIPEPTEDIVESTKTSNYFEHSVRGKYTLNDQYKEAAFKYTNITINDLQYAPNSDGHRLYLKNVNYSCSSRLGGEISYTGKLYYRSLTNSDKKDNPKEWTSAYDGYNTLWLYSGPGFIKN